MARKSVILSGIDNRKRFAVHLIDKAMMKAMQVYSGKTDLAGQPYILHPLRLMAKAKDHYSMVLALMHDVIEMSGMSPEDCAAQLREEGFPTELVDDLMLLTRMPGESYMQYIDRLKGVARVRSTKKDDIEDNMQLLRLKSLTESDLKRQAKYHKAWTRLNAAETSCQK